MTIRPRRLRAIESTALLVLGPRVLINRDIACDGDRARDANKGRFPARRVARRRTRGMQRSIEMREREFRNLSR